MEREDDVELIRRILSGDDAAFNILVEKYQESIHALAWRKIRDFHYAEEIMQDTFLKAYKKLPTLKNPNQFAGWLHVIANHLCIDWVRKQKPAMQSLEDTRLEEIEESSYTQHISEQRMTERSEYCQELVKNLLEKLPENERTVITLYYFDEMSTKEIGEFMGVSVNTITSRLQRARKRLQTDRELLDQEFFSYLELSDSLKENIMSQLEQLRNKFNSFMEKVKSDPASREDILKEASNEIENSLKGEITSELAHLVVDDIYPCMGKLGMEKRVSLLRKYMDNTLDEKERYWAHRGLVNSLAFLRRNREAIEEQTLLYRWACKQSEKFVLRIISNLSVAGCWKAEGRTDDWIKLYNEASQRLENPEVSGYTRCDFLQMGAEILRSYDRLDEALLGIEKLENANKEPKRSYYFRFWLAVRTNRLLLYSKLEDWDRFDQVFTETNTYIEGELKQLDAGFPVNVYELTWAAHDLGCCLVWSKKYSEAKHILQIAIDLGNENHYGHFQLAVSIWASEKDREKTLHHLKIAQGDYIVDSYNYQDSYYPTFLKTPEFSDVKGDPEFLKVLGQK
ncbi:MAG: RNA polymerase sigma factor [Candidatus Poribacteria bacterium]|nr:RNA polymerase sigma factor [Candidatus Poribacteria bacterium]